MLKVTSLSKTFRTDAGDVHAVQDVSFTANDGEMVAIVGASGSGKSTLLSMLGLLDSPDSGSISVNDTELAYLDARGRSDYRARKVGFVFQQFNLVPNLTAIDNVKLALEFAQWPKNERHARAERMLAMVGLDTQKISRRPSRLSGGEQQRVAVARAFAAQAGLILADEPTGNLDSETGKRIVELLRTTATQEKATVLVVTHDQAVADQADRRLRIVDGKLTEIA
jgi:putative ABC transport system ATP-binding protein